jgi:hypothetical protein
MLALGQCGGHANNAMPIRCTPLYFSAPGTGCQKELKMAVLGPNGS